MARFKVLSTKKIKESLVEEANKEGIAITAKEFISIRPVFSMDIWKQVTSLVEKGVEHVAFTSANAVETVDRYHHQGDIFYVLHWKSFCLSGRTKEALLQSRYLEKEIAGEAKNAADLAGVILASGIRELIFFCGNQRRNVLPDRLRAAGLTVHEIIVYETVKTPVVTTVNLDAVLFFSPSAVSSFFSVNQLKPHTVCFAVGTTTAEALAAVTDNKIITSEEPSQDELVALVVFYFKNINCYE